ncbi:MAG: universal stress protein, partial [Proteobacteria bacterium]
VVDAMPFFKAADRVKVVVVNEGSLAAERGSMLELVNWLKSHDVKADGDVLPLLGNLGETIGAAAHEHHADLVVSGAYGHSRFREWLLGGATRELLGASTFSRLMSS